MSENSQPLEEIEGEGEDAQQVPQLPYFWKHLEVLIEEASNNDSLERELVRLVNRLPAPKSNDDEEEEEEDEGEDAQKTEKPPSLKQVLTAPHPESKQTILTYANEKGFTKLLRTILERSKNESTLDNLLVLDEKERSIYDKWCQEKLRIQQEEERKRILEEKKQRGEEVEEEEEAEEEEEGEEKVDFVTKLSREFGTPKEGGPAEDEEEEGESDNLEPYPKEKIEAIGRFGVYEGPYKEPTEEQLESYQDDMDQRTPETKREEVPRHPWKFIRHGSNAQVLFENSDVYIGDYNENQKSGRGTYIYLSVLPKQKPKSEDEEEEEEEDKKEEEPIDPRLAQLSWYHGEWSNNQRHGNGIMYYPDGSHYHGEFKNNQRDGFGTLTYPNNDQYIGQWSEDKKHGKGKYKFKQDGAFYEGEWKENIFESGRWVLNNGLVVYDGKFRGGVPDGRGTMSFRIAHAKQEGYFRSGRWYPFEQVQQA